MKEDVLNAVGTWSGSSQNDLVTGRFDITLWKKLPNELKVEILKWALEDSGNEIMFTESSVMSTMDSYFSPNSSSIDHFGLGLLFLASEYEVSAIARAIVYAKSQIVISTFDVNTTRIRYPNASVAKFVHRSLRVLRFLQRLADGSLGFTGLKSLVVTIVGQGLWNEAELDSIKASKHLLMQGVVQFGVDHLEIHFEAPDPCLHETAWDDMDHGAFDEGWQEMKSLAQAVYRQFTLRKKGDEHKIQSQMQYRSDPLPYKVLSYS
ncbi:hypothetical protein N0V87_008737 [Didymella glomerata]|uniref:Uncharacterized protein n=1 Tax=Didymella glomerata TaxID=749621 RepID=A0A9W8WT00_9PLEO|nr:hypothetical protein N0V87_008737 [Didymella glomerata]